MTELKWFYGNGELKGELPQECVEDCSGSGDASDSVEHWVKELEFVVDRKQAIKWLEEFGAWDTLETDSIEDITQRVLWLACSDISEDGEWIGLVHQPLDTHYNTYNQQKQPKEHYV